MYVSFVFLFQYLEMRLFEKAIEAWRNATVMNPSIVSAWVNLAFQLDNYGKSYMTKGPKQIDPYF